MERKSFLWKIQVIGQQLYFYLVKGLLYRWFTGENVRCKYYVESLCLDFFVNRSWISKKKWNFQSWWKISHYTLVLEMACLIQSAVSVIFVWIYFRDILILHLGVDDKRLYTKCLQQQTSQKLDFFSNLWNMSLYLCSFKYSLRYFYLSSVCLNKIFSVECSALYSIPNDIALDAH